MVDNNREQESKWLSNEKLQLLNYLLEEENIQTRNQDKISSVADHQDAPLSFSQERLWFLEQLNSNTALYNQFFAIRLTGDLHLMALEQSLHKIIQRHETLRATFIMVNGLPVQHISYEQAFTLTIENLQGCQESQQEHEIRQRAQEEARQPFDLIKGPLVRSLLLCVTPTEYVLFMTVHHIVFDGWSRGVFTRELIELYKAYAAGQKPSLPPLPIQYADFALWQRQWLRGEALDAQMSYWRQTLGDNPPILEMPTDHPRLGIQTFQGAVESIAFSQELLESLKALSMREGATLFMTLLAAFQVLLAQTAEQNDIVVGTRIAGRDRIETEGLIGCFINALVMRTDMSGNPTFREILYRVRETVLGAFSHQDIPFEKVVEGLRLKRDMSRQPLFQVMFVLQTVSIPILELPNLTISPLETELEMARYDLDCSMKVGDDGRLWCSLIYNTHLFQSRTIQSLLSRFQILLEAVSFDPDLLLWELQPATQEDQKQIKDWNAAANTHLDDTRLHILFEERVIEMPDAIAVIYEQQAVTYLALNNYANQLAHRLSALGIGPEKMVGVYMRRSLRTIISLLAILKVGGVYVPLDPSSPPVLLSSILSDTNVSVLIADGESVPDVPHEATLIHLDAHCENLIGESTSNIKNNGVLDNAAYVMFTSGSTGRPKGVVVPQRQVLNRFFWMWRAYPFSKNEKICQRTTANFAPSIWEMLGSLLQGVPVVIVPDATVKDPLLFVPSLAEHAITRIVIVPSLLEVILNTSLDLTQLLSQLKLWSIGGEPLTVKLAQRFQERLPHATLINQYGATEMSDVVYCDTWSRYQHATNVPSGRPITNTQIYLLDAYWHLRPIGLPGELYVSGPGVPRGYLNRPDLTAERFIPDPFSTEPGARLYNMGDIARYLPDGVLDLLGRRDHQIKIRGFRVEVGGIEAVLREHPSVQQAAVAIHGIEQGTSNKFLVAYIVPVIGEAPAITMLRNFMKDRLPDYMLPSDFVMLDALPKTPNGKIDRRALLEIPSDPSSMVSTPLVTPQTEMELAIAKIWQEVLQVQEIGIHSNFFDLGGHSLLSIEVRNKLQEMLHKEVTLIDLFEHPTISALASHLGQQQEVQHSLEHVQENAEAQRTLRKRRKQFRETAEKHKSIQE